MAKSVAIMSAAAAALVFATAAGACPDRRYGPNSGEISITGPDALGGRAFRVLAGGHNMLSRCRPSELFVDGAPVAFVDGHVATVPDFEMVFSGHAGYRLELGVESDCGATLLVSVAPEIWHFDDAPSDPDATGPAGRIVTAQMFMTSSAESVIDVWIGSPTTALCDAVFYVRTHPLDQE